VSVAEAYPNARIRMIYPVGATYAAATAKGCSTDPFANRPSSLASLELRDTDWATAGATRLLTNTGASGGNVHKAGRPFTVQATAVNSGGATTANYSGTPTATLSTCGAGGCGATLG